MDIREFAGKLAEALGSGWSLAPVVEEWHHRNPTIVHKDGPNFWLSGDGWAKKGSYGVHANYPKDSQGKELRPYFSNWSQDSDPGINFSQAKTPEQAAKDITRRFLPAYLPLWEKQQTMVNGNNAFRTNRKKLAEQVVEILGGTVIEDSNGIANVRLRYEPERTGAWVSEVKLSSASSVEFTISGTVDTLKAVKALLDKS